MTLNWEKYGIDISKARGGKLFCPNCSEKRKNKHDKPLSVDIEKGLFNCHHCDFKGSVVEYKKREYIKPVPRLQKVSDKVLKYFETRGISNDTLLRLRITESIEWMPVHEKEIPAVCFNYFRNDELVNIKFRGAGKSFKMAKDAELIFYNIDSIKDENTAIIVEGEIDCLSFHECGIYNSVSVPNGASKGSQKLEYLDNCWADFAGKDKIIIATDNDEAGLSLRDELARRLGVERCYQINYPEGCKDANEVLLKHGKTAVSYLIEMAIPWPIEGIESMDSMYETVVNFYDHGYPKGAEVRINGFDELLTFYKGQLTLITGIPGSGKDEFCNWLMTRLSKNAGWKWGTIQFEEPNTVMVTKLIEKFTDKSFSFRKEMGHRITKEDFEYGVAMVDKYFHFVNTSEIDITIDGIIEKADQLVTRYGINGIILNPWNCIEHKKSGNQSETEYVSECLQKFITFLKRRDVHGFLVAHPTKIKKDEKTGKYKVATLYDISGSAHFFNKTHNGMSVYRDFDTNIVDVYVQKVKDSWLGKLGYCTFSFDPMTRKYQSLTEPAFNNSDYQRLIPVSEVRNFTEPNQRDDSPF